MYKKNAILISVLVLGVYASENPFDIEKNIQKVEREEHLLLQALAKEQALMEEEDMLLDEDDIDTFETQTTAKVPVENQLSPKVETAHEVQTQKIDKETEEGKIEDVSPLENNASILIPLENMGTSPTIEDKNKSVENNISREISPSEGETKEPVVQRSDVESVESSIPLEIEAVQETETLEETGGDKPVEISTSETNESIAPSVENLSEQPTAEEINNQAETNNTQEPVPIEEEPKQPRAEETNKESKTEKLTPPEAVKQPIATPEIVGVKKLELKATKKVKVHKVKSSAKKQNKKPAVSQMKSSVDSRITVDEVATVKTSDIEDNEPWEFRLTPYVWFAGLEGNVASIPGAPVMPIDISPSDALEDTGMSLMAIFEAKKNGQGFFADFFYSDVQSEASLIEGINLALNSTSKTTMITGAYLYEVHHSEKSVVDLFAGARYWKIDTHLSFGNGLGILAGREVEHKESWVDPLLGIKGRTVLGDTDFYISGAVAVGGFGIGSDHFYDLSANIGYQWSESIGTTVGYRIYDLDYENDGFEHNIKQQGLTVGLTLAF